MSAGSGLSAGQVARRLGVAVTTIRTWDRRYGLGPARREQGRHRRYDEQDLHRLELMRRLTADGVAPAEAARIARAAGRPDRLTGPLPPAAAQPASLPQLRGLRRAALALDAVQVDRILRRAVAEDVAAAWTRLMCPALRDIGRRHAATGRYVDVEHLLSQAVSAALSRVERPDAAPAVLLACAPDEQHSLPLEALAAALAARGTASRMLGARVPAAALVAAITRTGPRAVVLWAHAPATADAGQLAAVLAARPRPALVAACGPGWDPGQLPAGVHGPADLAQALDQLAQVTPLPATEGA